MLHYVAPLEGITNQIYRGALFCHFGDGIDKWFTPFIEPHLEKENLNHRERMDILPENNEGMWLVPQILTNSAELFHAIAKDICAYGYQELNINLGCPYKTVVSKGRGAGMLADLEKLARFLDGIYDSPKVAEGAYTVSLKTRLGVDDPEEFGPLLELFARYPMKELIVHPRVQKEMYEGMPHNEWYTEVKKYPQIVLCCNGDMNTPEESARVAEVYQPQALMYGRGVVANPALIRIITGGKPAARGEMIAFMDDLLEAYAAYLSGETPVLHKMKEVWGFLIRSYPGQEKAFKKLIKAKNFREYREAAAAILNSR